MADIDRIAEEIARKHLQVGTLRERGRDNHDFHEIHVRGIKDALRAAYEAGRMDALAERSLRADPYEAAAH